MMSFEGAKNGVEPIMEGLHGMEFGKDKDLIIWKHLPINPIVSSTALFWVD
jgi:hypothetical protein